MAASIHTTAIAHSYQRAMAKTTRDSNYWQGRLEREHPAIAERLRSGEIPSVRAAAIEAGLIRERTPLADLRRAWARAAQEERQAFLVEAGVAPLPVVDHDRLAKMSDDELSAELKRVIAKNEPWGAERKAILAEIHRRHHEFVGQHLAEEKAWNKRTIEAVRERMAER